MKLVTEALSSPVEVHQIVVADGAIFPATFDEAMARRGLVPVPVPIHSFERIASTSSPQPVLAELSMPVADWAQVAHLDGPLLVAVDLNDPGNVGTLARSAEAGGFAGLVLLGSVADAWAPKTFRSSAGALLRLPVFGEGDVGAGLQRLGAGGYQRVGTRMRDATPCDEADLLARVAIVLGSEAHGLSSQAATSIDRWISVPMAGSVESLNVAMAGTILAYEVARQRREAGDGGQAR